MDHDRLMNICVSHEACLSNDPENPAHNSIAMIISIPMFTRPSRMLGID